MLIRNIFSITSAALFASAERRCHGRHDPSLVARKMALLISAASEGIYIIDLNGNLIEFNESFSRMLQYKPNELQGMHVSVWNPNWNPADVLDQLFPVLDRTVVIETQHRRANGSMLDVEVTYSCTSIDGVEYVCATSRDISERKRLEQELRIAAIAFEAHEAMLVTDAECRILQVNRAFAEVSGYKMEELVGQNLSILYSQSESADLHADLWGKVHAQGYWRGEMVTQCKCGKSYSVWCTITEVKNGNGGVTNYVATMTDITRRKAAEKEITELAYYDPLTKLGNRRLLHDRLRQALELSEHSGSCGALFFIDLDNFKTINETAGHETGDHLLQHVGQRLLLCVRDNDTVARLGGDEFVVILADLGPDLGRATQLTQQIGERILLSLNTPYDLNGNAHFSSPSIGVSMFGAERETVTELLRRADMAMYEAKAGGKNALRYFDPAMQATVTARSQLEGAMRHGLQHNGFILHYQPQVSQGGKLIGAEALVRWHHPERGWLSPTEFIPIAEESGLIIPLGQRVLALACRQLKAWEKRFDLDGFSMSVNVSARQFRQPDFVQQVMATVGQCEINPHKLKLELTESMLVDNVDDTIAKITALKSAGVGFSLDDFGTGYSSLSYLKRLPLDQLKIDQSFVRDVLSDRNDAAIAQMIVTLGASLGLNVIAEGVETEQQRAFLSRLGCHAYQGYLFGRPMTADAFDAYLAGACERPDVPL